MATECRHCWHNTGEVLLSKPPQYPQVCCHCNESRVYIPPPPRPYDFNILPACGPYAPEKHSHIITINVGGR